MSFTKLRFLLCLLYSSHSVIFLYFWGPRWRECSSYERVGGRIFKQREQKALSKKYERIFNLFSEIQRRESERSFWLQKKKKNGFMFHCILSKPFLLWYYLYLTFAFYFKWFKLTTLSVFDIRKRVGHWFWRLSQI